MILTSCGHRVRLASNVISLTTKNVDSSGKRSVRYGSYCPECAAHLSKKGVVLETDDQEHEWLIGNEKLYIYD